MGSFITKIVSSSFHIQNWLGPWLSGNRTSAGGGWPSGMSAGLCQAPVPDAHTGPPLLSVAVLVLSACLCQQTHALIWKKRVCCVFCHFKLLKPLGQFKWNILWSLKFNQIIFKNSVLPSQKNCASLQLQLTDTYFQNYIKRIYPIHGQMLSFYMLKHIIPIVTTVQCFNGLKPSKKSAIISTLHFYAWDLGSVPQLQTYGDNIHECSLWNKAKTVTIGNAIWYCSLKWL